MLVYCVFIKVSSELLSLRLLVFSISLNQRVSAKNLGKKWVVNFNVFSSISPSDITGRIEIEEQDVTRSLHIMFPIFCVFNKKILRRKSKGGELDEDVKPSGVI